MNTEQQAQQFYEESVKCTSLVCGDVPSLLGAAYEQEFGRFPIQREASEPVLDDIPRMQKLGTDISALQLRDPRARSFLTQAARILATNGAEVLSMNIPLDPGQELPNMLHTLIHGTLWAVLMQACTDPDVEGHDPKSQGRESPPVMPDMAIWFLCKKTMFAARVARKDGRLTRTVDVGGALAFCLCYSGRLFCNGIPCCTTDPDAADHIYKRVHVPPVLYHWTTGREAIALTAQGLYGWGENRMGSLGVGEHTNVPPTRLTFPSHPAIAQLLRSPAACALGLFMGDGATIIATPVGVMAAGSNIGGRLGVGTDARSVPWFQHVPLPAGFTPTSAVISPTRTILKGGTDSLVAGDNRGNQLMLGESVVSATTFAQPSFPVDQIWAMSGYTVILSGHTLFCTGTKTRHMSVGRVVSGGPGLPAQLNLPHPVKAAVFISKFNVDIWVLVRADGHGSYGLFKSKGGEKGRWSVPLWIGEWSVEGEVSAVRVKFGVYWIRTEAGWHEIGSHCLDGSFPRWSNVKPQVFTDVTVQVMGLRPKERSEQEMQAIFKRSAQFGLTPVESAAQQSQ
ncbi:hypothetical protein J8273_5701 [Carpediemonas membranifera]|uniref:Uncharacterized protein n=1 Tax=Carpediemonas membranifera TaxID=201153 RepID=A0A8J6DYY5_9EUKA|nr:hypothetical protein J8273_5701 [Carpediemonas membranifera]|eukprot:KAG9392889.1 hypothetical protein J8273_5701 [Carpediemonas membranifera]